MDKSIPTGAEKLLDFIGSIEAPRGYGTIYANKQHLLKTPLTSMTLNEVLAAQIGWSKNHGSSAAGRYQFMRRTLLGLMQEMSLVGSQKMDANLQDRMGFHLLRRRGYDLYVAGAIDLNEFGKRLAMEWASLPVLIPVQGAHRKLKRGQSYYEGDALNKSLVSPERVEDLLRQIRKMPDEFHVERETASVQVPPAPPTPAVQPGWWQRFFSLFGW